MIAIFPHTVTNNPSVHSQPGLLHRQAKGQKPASFQPILPEFSSLASCLSNVSRGPQRPRQSHRGLDISHARKCHVPTIANPSLLYPDINLIHSRFYSLRRLQLRELSYRLMISEVYFTTHSQEPSTIAKLLFSVQLLKKRALPIVPCIASMILGIISLFLDLSTPIALSCIRTS